MRQHFTIIILASMALLSTGTAIAETAISYQGRLDAGGQAFDGSVDMDFELFDAESGGSAMGSPTTINGVVVQQGLFQVELDFGIQAWELGRWLQITVDGQLLSPRQKVSAAPLASRAETVVEEAVGSQELEDGGVQAQDIANNSIHSNHIVDGTVNGTDTDRSFWNSVTRGNLSMLADGLSLNAGTLGTATARCESPDDMPVTGECFADNFSNVTLRRLGPADWEVPTTAGGWSCTYANIGASTVTIEARIYCLDVTP